MAFLLPVHLQTVLGYGPLQAGIAYLPYGAGILAGMWLSSRAATRLGTRWALVVSFLVSAAGLLLLSGVAPGDQYAAAVLPGMLVTSLGCGLSLPVLTAAAVTGTTEENAGLGSAVLTSVQQVGGAVGVAVLVPGHTRQRRPGQPDGRFLPRTHGRRRPHRHPAPEPHSVHCRHHRLYWTIVSKLQGSGGSMTVKVGSGLAFERRGSGPPVVLLHGIGHDRHAWDPVVDELARQRELVLVDLPGHGDSALPENQTVLGVHELTDVVERFLAEQGLKSAMVVGNSLGGAIALELARRNPSRAAVALAPIGFWSRAEVGYVVAVLRTSQVLARLFASTFRRALSWPVVRATALGIYFAHPLRLTTTEALRTVRGFAESPGVNAILPHSRHYRFARGEFTQDSVTIAWGTKDRLLIGRQPRRARALLPRAHHVRLAGSGHVPMVDDPAGVIDLVLGR